MTFESSNTEMLESMTSKEVIDLVRTAMKSGCIHPSHVYDAIDELICRVCKAENIQEN